MTHRLTKALVALALLLAAPGCKREALTQQQTDTATDNPLVQKVQQWLKIQPGAGTIAGRKAGSTLPLHTLQWAQAKLANGSDAYIVPAKLSNAPVANNFVKTNFVALLNKEGQITSGQYIMVLPDRQTMGDAAAKGFNHLILLYPQPDAQPMGFSGAVLYYGMDGQLTGNKVYNNGTLVRNATANLATKDNPDSDPSPYHVVQNCDGPGASACIDWFWQTYINGELVDEDYLYTTCCGGTSGGGSGGTGVTAEQACANELDAFVNMGSAEEGPVNANYTPMGPNAWEAKYSWRIYKDAANPWEIVSYETGIMKRPNPQTGFSFQSFRHDNIRHNGVIRTGGTRTYQELGAAVNHNALTANINLTFSVISSISCNTTNKVKETFTKSKSFNTLGVNIIHNPD